MKISKKIGWSSKFLFFIVVGLLLVSSISILWSGHVNSQVKQNAKEFCDSVQINESLSSLYSKCRAAQVDCSTGEPMPWESDGLTRHQAWFRGSLLYAYTCEIRSENGKVVSKFYEEFTD